MREVRLHLTLHPLHLFADRLGEVVLARAGRPLGFVRQDGERGLQTVREVAGSRDRALHGLLAVVEQEVQVVDEWLHFGGVGAVDEAFTPLMYSGQSQAQAIDVRQAASHLNKADDHAHDRNRRPRRRMREEVVKEPRCFRVVKHDLGHDHAGRSEETRGPEHGAEEDPGTQRSAEREARRHWASSPMR